MARLEKCKKRDENRYSTFDGEPSYNSSENLTETNRIKILSTKKSKWKMLKSKKNSSTPNCTKPMAKTMPTISASIEMHRNKIAQSRPVNASSDGITRARRRSANQSIRSRSKLNSCLNAIFCTRKCNWGYNESAGAGPGTGAGSSNASCCNRCCCCCFSWWKWCCKRKCCARICCGCIDYDDSENDECDIDAKFEQYKYEMRLNELKREREYEHGQEYSDIVNESPETSFQSNSYRIESPTTSNQNHNNNTVPNDGNKLCETATSTATINGKTLKPTSIIFRYRKYWNWNDSLRSNSDKFLETLEYDMDGEQSLQRTNNKHPRTDASVRIKGYTPDLHVVWAVPLPSHLFLFISLLHTHTHYYFLAPLPEVEC